MEEERPDKSADNRREDGTFGPGNIANPNGRPKGKTMKEFAREFLMSMTDEKKLEFLNSLTKDIVWKMAEGQPHQTTDITSAGKPIPILGNVHSDNGNKQNNSPEEKN